MIERKDLYIMSLPVKESREQLQKRSLPELKNEVEKHCWVALKQYFDGGGTGVEAKVAVVTLGVLAKEMQAKNNSRQLDLIEERLKKLGRDKQLPFNELND